MASTGLLAGLDISLLELNKHSRLVPVSGLQNRRATETGWPDTVAAGERLPPCLVCPLLHPSRLQRRRMCEWVFPMDQMWVLQERGQFGVTVTPAQEDHTGEQRRNSRHYPEWRFRVTGAQQESFWKTHTSAHDRKYAPARPREHSHLILVLVKVEHLPLFHRFLNHCNPTNSE